MSHAPQPDWDPHRPTPPTGTPSPPRRRRLQEATTRPVTPLEPHRRARRAPGPRRGTAAVRRLVGLARVLAGGLVVLAVVVLVAPLVLGGPGPGADVVVGHLAAALIAVGATAVAAHRRTPVAVACGAALVVPIAVAVLLGVVWWS